MADTVPPPLTDADLANLTYEQLAALINEGNPNDFYNEAIAFDEAAGRLRQLLDDFQRESRTLQDFVSGEIEAALDQVTQKHSAWIDSVLQAMTNPGYAQALRNAGDALAAGQQRLRDQQTATAQANAAAPPPPEQGEQTKQQALQILTDIGTAYRDVGGMFTALPDNYGNPRQSFSNGPGGGEAGPGNGAPGPGYGTQYVGGRFLTENSYFHTDSTAGGTGELVTGGPGAVAPGGGVFAASATGGGGAFVSALGRSDSTVDFAPAQELAEVSVEGSAGPAPVMAAGMLAPGVLGRPAAKNKSERKVTTTTTEEPEVLLTESGERPETESTTPKFQPAEVAIPAIQPATTTAGLPVTAGIPATASAGSPVPPVKHALSAPAFDLRADFGASRGLAEPASFREVTTELAAVTEPRPTAAMTTPAATPGQNPAASGHSMPMMPMGMGMGGMRGGAGQENNERFADVPVPPEAEVWNPVGSGGAVLGRPDRRRDPEPSASPDPCPEQGDVEAAKSAAMQAILGKTERS